MENSPTLHRYIDHTLLKATATEADITKLCEEAVKYRFFSVCVNGAWVSLAARLLKKTPVAVCSVVGFPLGASHTIPKMSEVSTALEDGAKEIDMVMNIGKLKSGKDEEVKTDIRMMKMLIDKKILKVIIETCYLTDKEKVRACRIAVEAGADFVKTATGFGPGGATVADILLMKEAVNGQARIKASGGIKDAETAKRYIELGVSRIGTSSGVAIVTGDAATED